MGALSTLLGPTLVRGASRTLASTLLGAESDGLAADFTDMSMVVKDTATPANAFSGDPNSKLTYSSPSTKWILGSNGLYSSGTTLRTEYNTSGAALGCRIEEARTNLCLRSQEMDNASWTASGCTVSANAANGIDGTATADQLVENTSTVRHSILQAVTLASSSTYTLSVYAKYVDRQYLSISLCRNADADNYAAARFDVQNGTLASTANGSSGGTVSATAIESLPNGLYRFSVTGTIGAFTDGIIVISTALDATTWTAASRGAQSFLGSSKIVTLSQAQLELGAFPTSPIVTAGSTVTRAADNISIATSLFNYSATAGTLFAKFRIDRVATATVRALELGDGTFNERVFLAVDTDNSPLGTVTDGAVAQAVLDAGGSPASGTVRKQAIAYAANDFALVYNNGTAQTDATGTLPTMTALYFGQSGAATGILCGHLQQAMHLPRRMSNVDMGTLTT